MKFIYSSLLMFIIIACSSNTDAPDNEDIFSGIFNQNYEGGISYTATGDVSANFQSDSSQAIVLTDKSGAGLPFFIFDQRFRITFNGITDGSKLALSIVDTIGVLPGEVNGAIFNDSLSVFAESGDFVFTRFDKSTMRGSFSGMFADHQDTVNISGNFELEADPLIK